MLHKADLTEALRSKSDVITLVEMVLTIMIWVVLWNAESLDTLIVILEGSF